MSAQKHSLNHSPTWLPSRKPRITLVHGLAISLLLHSMLGLSWLAAGRLLTQPPQRERLQLELFGMLADRQVVEKHVGQEISSQEQLPQEVAPEPEPEPEPKPEPEPEPKPEPEPEPELEPEPKPQEEKVIIPVKAKEPAPKPRAQTKRVPVMQPVQAAPTAAKGADETREQQIKRQEDMDTLMRAYGVQIRKEIQRNLVYPREARKDGLEGSPTIRLTITETGGILPGSLVIHKSSGHAMLDEQALQTARDSVPFPPPPRQMSITISISFKEKKR